MAEAAPQDNPDDLAQQAHQQRIMDSFEGVGYLAQAALNLGSWAPYVDWSQRLSGEGTLTDPALIEAFAKVRRYDFLPPATKPRAAEDRPLPIGHQQTNSQPSTVAKMLEWLDLQPGQRVLDVGVGSGWTTALMAEVVGKEGVVHGTERIPELVRFARANLAPYGQPNAVIHRTPKRLGLLSEGPYDRILVSAATKLPWAQELFRRQLSREGGIMVVPITEDEAHGTDNHDKELAAIRNDAGSIDWLQREKGYAFVPLVLPEDR